MSFTPRADAAGDIDGEALMGEFIDQGQAFQLLPIGAGIEDEVVGLDMVGCRGRQGTRKGRRPAARSFARQLQRRLAPQTFSPAGPHDPALPFQEDPDAAIAIVGVL